ncbi:hypothetical protein DVH05_002680 [Phytophthora capsici]|nr:hypothetical protein DVH05_002680 [Phytophthora capsici]
MKHEYFMSSVPIIFEYTNEKRTAERNVISAAGAGDSGRREEVADRAQFWQSTTHQRVQQLPKAQVLTTFLPRVNQHEVTVTVSKFRNLKLVVLQQSDVHCRACV